MTEKIQLPEQVSYLIRMMNNEKDYAKKLVFLERLRAIAKEIQSHIDTFEIDNMFSKTKPVELDPKTKAQLNFSRVGRNNV